MQHNKELTKYAQDLRKNMTKEEKQLWYQYLRTYSEQFRRQVTCGQYILDFYCAKAKVAVELDGSQHFEPDNEAKDQKRTEFLNNQGILVVRIPNNEIWKNLDGVCAHIDEVVQKRL